MKLPGMGETRVTSTPAFRTLAHQPFRPFHRSVRFRIAGMPAVALTDRANLFGALEFSVATKEAGVQPIVGCALPVTGIGEGPPERWARTPTVVLLAQNEAGYRNLMALSSAAYLDIEPTDEPHVPWAKVAAHAEGLILLSGGPDGPVDPLFAAGRTAEANAALAELQAACSATASMSSCSATAWPPRPPPSRGWWPGPTSNDAPLVATNDVYFARPRCTRRTTPCCASPTAPSSARTSAGGSPPSTGSSRPRTCAACSPTCRRPATTPSISPGAAPSWWPSATRSCRASPPSAAARRPTNWPHQAREGLKARLAAIAPAGAGRRDYGAGWSARSASSSPWAFPATS